MRQEDARPTREQLHAMFAGKLVDILAMKIRRALPDQAHAVACEMLAAVEALGWRFITRGEQAALAWALSPDGVTAAQHPKTSKTVTFQKNDAGEPIGAVIQEW